MFLTGVTFADGDGYKIRKFSYTWDAARATTFAKAAAEAIAQQLAGSCVDVRIVRPGEPDTLVGLSDEQRAERLKVRQAIAELNREMAPIVSEFERLMGRS